MYIESLEITNFRGLTIKLNDLKKDFLIIGKNDSGKSNLCYAIRKVLDYNIRKNPLNEADSSNYNREPIKIKLTFNLFGITEANRSKLGASIEKFGEKETITINFEGNYNEEVGFYEEKINFGTIDLSKDYSTNITNPIDKVIEVIYINPNYNYERDVSDFFKYKQERNLKENKGINANILERVEELNQSIKSDDSIKVIKDELNSQDGFDSIFEDVEFDLASDINVSNLYKSLSIIPLSKLGTKINNIGDGKNKTLSMLLQKMSHDTDKHNILIVEEPENHLYPLLQKHYADLTSKSKMNQIIFTSHSPHIIDFKKMNQIIKLVIEFEDNKRTTKNYSINISENDYRSFGYLLNEEIAEIFFYDKVLLVEGVSEKYFYNSLFIQDDTFRNFIVRSRMGIFSVMGIDFSPTKELLNKLGIEVFIKTDNDIFKVPKIDKKRYAGYDRTLDCLSEASKIELAELLSKESINKESFRFDSIHSTDDLIELKLCEINKIFEKNKIFISSHHSGFEQDFLEFIGESEIDALDLEYLKEAKLKNLHKYVHENQIPIKINESNVDSILLRFMKND